MIRVTPQPEPPNFQVEIRSLGEIFLAKCPRPTTQQWNNHSYWTKCLDYLYEVHGGICAYCGEWIPETVGDPNVDHYIPKSSMPGLAFEWTNYRLASFRFNRWKKEYNDVIDPFEVGENWFQIQFPSCQVLVNSDLDPENSQRVLNTIVRLRLNSERCIRSRLRWILQYRDNKFPFEHVKANAPFLAHEIERQGLVVKIKEIMAT